MLNLFTIKSSWEIKGLTFNYQDYQKALLKRYF